MSEIPEPGDTGSMGTQEPASGDVLAPEAQSPLHGLSLANAIQGLAASSPRQLGGEVGANLLAAAFADLAKERDDALRRISEKDDKIARMYDQISDHKQREAALEERLYSLRNVGHLKNLAILIGTTLVLTCIEFFRNDLLEASLVSGLLGILLMLFGWLTSSGMIRR